VLHIWSQTKEGTLPSCLQNHEAFQGALNLALTYGQSFQNNVFIAYIDINYIVDDINNNKIAIRYHPFFWVEVQLHGLVGGNHALPII
jgi:hypothetical protein